jgi:uncharacterized protein YehS (DUF1456 family)
MNNNEILRRIRYIFNFNDTKMMSIFALAAYPVTRTRVSDWLKKEDDPACEKMSDTDLSAFLNGLICENRGRKPGPPPELETRLTNNSIFMKLKIALHLKAEDVINILALANLCISPHELSAFFRKPGHKHYRECRHQILRNFLKGLQLKYRPGVNLDGFEWKIKK